MRKAVLRAITMDQKDNRGGIGRRTIGQDQGARKPVAVIVKFDKAAIAAFKIKIGKPRKGKAADNDNNDDQDRKPREKAAAF
jgi:hypothetical protein